MTDEPGIYLEIKEASAFKVLGKYHAYLVYKKSDGTTEVIRGGHDQAFTKITVETGKSSEESEDRLREGEQPGSRPSRKLPIPDDKVDEAWSKMRDKTKEIGELGPHYRPFFPDFGGPDQTSNSVVRAALDAAGVPVEKALPEGVAPDKLPGIEDNLEDKLRRGPYLPTEGEIGGLPGREGEKKLSGAPAGGNDGDNPAAAGADAGVSQAMSAEARKFLDDLTKPVRPIDDILLKRPEDLTEGEFMALKKATLALPQGPEQDRADNMATRFLEATYGTQPVKRDAVGRLVEPRPVRPIPETPAALRTADGEPLEAGLGRIGERVAADARAGGLAQAILALQRGLNVLGEAPAASTFVAKQKPWPTPPGVFTTVPRTIVEDGLFGLETRSRLREAVARLGRPKVEEGIALGRFRGAAADRRGQTLAGLSAMTESAFGPLFRGSGRPPLRPEDRHETVALQETLNDLGTGAFGRERFPTLLLDGVIGPKTAGAFGRVRDAVGPGRLTRRFGEFLGFL